MRYLSYGHSGEQMNRISMSWLYLSCFCISCGTVYYHEKVPQNDRIVESSDNRGNLKAALKTADGGPFVVAQASRDGNQLSIKVQSNQCQTLHSVEIVDKLMTKPEPYGGAALLTLGGLLAGSGGLYLVIPDKLPSLQHCATQCDNKSSGGVLLAIGGAVLVGGLVQTLRSPKELSRQTHNEQYWQDAGACVEVKEQKLKLAYGENCGTIESSPIGADGIGRFTMTQQNIENLSAIERGMVRLSDGTQVGRVSLEDFRKRAPEWQRALVATVKCVREHIEESGCREPGLHNELMNFACNGEVQRTLNCGKVDEVQRVLDEGANILEYSENPWAQAIALLGHLASLKRCIDEKRAGGDIPFVSAF